MTTLALALWLAALPTQPLPATGGPPHALATDVKAHALTVVIFFSRECPVQRAHDARLKALVHDFAPRDVGFLAVDAQSTANLEQAQRDVAARGYDFPIVIDPDGTWADALGVRFSTTVVVLDREGRVRYRGGLDEQRVEVHEPFTPWARLALERLLSGQDADPAETKALGCVLRRR